MPESASVSDVELVERFTEFKVADQAVADPAIENEARELQVRFARIASQAVGSANQAFRSANGEVERITVEYLGKGRVADPAELPEAPAEMPSVRPTDEEFMASVPSKFRDGALWLDGFSDETLSEFQVRIPRGIARALGMQALADGTQLGKGNRDPNAEPRARQEVFRQLSDGIDDRSLIGTTNTAHTNFMDAVKVQVNGNSSWDSCSGMLIGPKHTLSAAHCVRKWNAEPANALWITGTLRAGRNGTAWRASASISSNRHYWVPSQFKNATVNPGSGPYDIGMFITHGGRMGDVTGWPGWWVYPSNSAYETFKKWNAGYPACAVLNAPVGCAENHLYGDLNACSVGGHSTMTDSAGIPFTHKHSCDTSGAMSGSPLYNFDTNLGAWVITAVHTGGTGTGIRPNIATRINSEFSDAIAALRQAWP